MKCSWTSPGSGAACDSEALTTDPEGKCWFHSDTNAEARAEARRRGGRNSRPVGVPGITMDVSTPEAILESLRAVGQAMADGRTDRSTANSLSYILATATQALKLVSHEKRIKALEIKLGLKEPDPE